MEVIEVERLARMKIKDRTRNVISVVRDDGEPEDFVAFICPVPGCSWDTQDWATRFEHEALQNYQYHWREQHTSPPTPIADRWSGAKKWVES